jgi:hypothetical protein
MNADRTVIGTFDRFFALTVNREGTGEGTLTSAPEGIDCGTDCAEDYSEGTTVTLIPMADPGSVFVGWTGCDAVDEDQCTLTIDGDKTITGTFRKRLSNEAIFLLLLTD